MHACVQESACVLYCDGLGCQDGTLIMIKWLGKNELMTAGLQATWTTCLSDNIMVTG